MHTYTKKSFKKTSKNYSPTKYAEVKINWITEQTKLKNGEKIYFVKVEENKTDDTIQDYTFDPKFAKGIEYLKTGKTVQIKYWTKELNGKTYRNISEVKPIIEIKNDEEVLEEIEKL